MSLYKNWTDMVLDYVKANGEEAFWKEYGQVEKKIYKKVLAGFENSIQGTFTSLKDEFEVSEDFFMGFLDGINESLNGTLDLENMEENTEVKLNIDYRKLYFNMLDSKADYLYNLPEWNNILTDEERKEITIEWRKSKIIVNPPKIGRNDDCPCGSGKKYKKCCGKEQ